MTLAHFQAKLFALLLNFKGSLYIWNINPLSYVYFAMFSQVYDLSFHSLNSIFYRAEGFNYNKV